MADKTIGQLTAATQLNDQDLMVLEQGGTAKKMAGSVLKQYVVGQGGIDHITLNADYTLTVTYTSGQSWTTPTSIRGAQGAQGNPGADGEDGNGIVSVAKTGTSGLIDTYTITFTDGTTSTFTVTNGEDGNTPVITATKSGKVTTIYSNGVAIATINDGEDGQGTGDMLKSVYSPNYAGELASKVDMQAKYTKPSGGIPKVDLASAVQTSLGLADTALQDAPSDGNQYARKDGAWAVVQGGGGSAGAVHYDEAQSLTDAQKWQACDNIGTDTKLTANRTYYVSASGSDSNDGLSASSPFATVNHALSLVPKNLNTYQVTVNIAGNITQDITVNGFYTGTILIVGGGSTVITGIVAVYNCDCIVAFNSISKFAANRSAAVFTAMYSKYVAFWGASNTGKVEFVGYSMSETFSCYTTIVVLINDKTYEMSGGYYGVIAMNGAQIGVNGTLSIKSGIHDGVLSKSGSTIMLQNITNSATTKYVYGGGIVIKGSTINPTT